jgi:hypothetical protein
MTLEALNQILKWTVAVLPFALAFAGVGALITNNMINARKDAEIQSLKPRAISETQRRELLHRLTNSHGRVGFMTRLMDAESGDYADQLADIFKAAGWDIAPTVKTSLNDLSGFVTLTATNPNLAGLGDTVANALNAAGIDCHPQPIEPNSVGGGAEPDTLYIVVGRKK